MDQDRWKFALRKMAEYLKLCHFYSNEFLIFIRLCRRLWTRLYMNVQTIVMLRRDVAPKLGDRVIAEGEDGQLRGTTALPVRLHRRKSQARL
jgi:hypothetical protein